MTLDPYWPQDDTDGPTPPYANPGAPRNANRSNNTHTRYHCDTHDTGWTEGGCWICEEDVA